MIDDTNNPEETQEVTPSVTEQTNADVGEDVKAPVADSVPYNRFKEVIDEKNSFKTELDMMKQEIESLKAVQEPEPEPTTYQEVEERAVKKAITQFERRQAETQAQDRAREEAIDNKFEQLKDIGQEITPDIRKAVLTKILETGNDDVVAHLLEVKKSLDKTSKAETLKKEGYIPPSHKGSPAAKSFSYKEIRSKSIDDILAEAGE